MTKTSKNVKLSEGKQESSKVYSTAEDDTESTTMEELEATLAQTQQKLVKVQEETKELTQQLATTVPRSQALQIRKELEVKIEELTIENQELTETVEEERREREWVEKELRAQYEATALTEKEMNNLQEFIKKLHNLLEEKGRFVEGQKDEKEAIARILDEAKEEVGRLKKDSKMKSRALTRIEDAHKELSTAVKEKDESLGNYQKEVAVVRRHYDRLHKELRRQNEKRSEVENQLKLVRGQVRVATEQVKVRGRQERLVRREVDRVTREKEALQRSLVKATAQEKKQTGLVLLGEKEKEKSHNLYIKTMMDLHQQDKLVVELQDARDRQLEATAQVEGKVVDMAGEVESREKEIEDIFRRHIVLSNSLNKCSNVIQALKVDNFASRREINLIKAENLEQKERTRQGMYLTGKMADLCDIKDKKVSEIETDLTMAKCRQQGLSERLGKAEEALHDQCLTLQFLEGEKSGLQRIVEKQEISLGDFNQIVQEEQSQRGMEITTLSRRNDEVSALQSRVKLLEHILKKGNKEYEQRLKEIRTLKIELQSVKNERDVLFRQVDLVKSLKGELVRQQNLLVSTLKQQTYLQNSLINAKSLHPLSAQQVSNADTSTLMKKNRHLQKRYLASTERIAALEVENSQKTREMDELRRIIDRTSSFYDNSPDSLMTKLRLQNKLWAKEEQLKSVTAALNASLLKLEDCEQEKLQMKAKLNHQLSLRMKKQLN